VGSEMCIRDRILTTIIVITNKAISKRLETHNLEYSLIAARVVNNPMCLAYQECSPNGENCKTYPGIIDKQRFTKDILESCLVSTDMRELGVMATLQEKGQIKPKIIYANQTNYEDFAPLSFSNLYVKVNKTMYVIIKDGDKRIPGILSVVVTGETR